MRPSEDRPLLSRPTVAGLALVVAIAAIGVAYGLAGRNGSGPLASRSDNTDWGPLAVSSLDTGAVALSAGAMHITDQCVFLEGAGSERSVLVWNDRRTRWNADAREIVLQNHDGSEVSIRDGELVTFSGGGDLVTEVGVPGDEWIAGTEWVSMPDVTCPIDSRWFVNEIVAPT